MIKAGSYRINKERIIFVQELDKGHAYVHLAGAGEVLALLPDETAALLKAFEQPMPPGWGQKVEKRIGDA